MGVCGSNLTAEEKKAVSNTYKLDKDLANTASLESRKMKLLLLGAGESGKSTIFKQMKILYGEGFSDKDRVKFNPLIHANCINNIRTLIEACETLKIVISANTLANEMMAISPEATLTPKDAEAIKTLWGDAGIQAAYTRRAEFQCNDTCEYFFKHLDRIVSPGYVASVDDVLKSRLRTTGIVEETYIIKGATFVMYDVGGQRSERKKWISCFDMVTAVIFVASISEYDQVLYEDHSQNRIHEGVTLFDEIVNSKWFKKTSMILFLNKKDLFEKKIKLVDIKQKNPNRAAKGDKMGRWWFEDYTYGLCTCGKGYPSEEICSCGVQDHAKNYIKKLFLDKANLDQKQVYEHITTATDTSNISTVFDACREIIVNKALQGSGFV